MREDGRALKHQLVEIVCSVRSAVRPATLGLGESWSLVCNLDSSLAGTAPLLSSGSRHMPHSRTVYRGYVIYVSEGESWSVRAEPIDPGFPILPYAMYDSQDSRRSALRTIKREIDRLLSW
jgi:hypothetical protein